MIIKQQMNDAIFKKTLLILQLSCNQITRPLGGENTPIIASVNRFCENSHSAQLGYSQKYPCYMYT